MKRTLLSTTLLGSAVALAALLVPGIASAAGPLPAPSACTDSGTTVDCELWAKPGTLSLPDGSTVAIWGYADSAAGSPTIPGPTLIADEGDQVNVTLHNGLVRPTSILFGGQALVPDIAGVAASGTTTYAFTADAPGTYAYEAGLIPGAQYQVAMGLYGVLVVRPTGDPISPAGVAVTRSDAGVTVTTGATTVADAAVLATDLGSVVSGTGIPVGATIVAVTAGTSFELSAPATADGSAVAITRTDPTAQATYGSATVADTAVLVTDVGSAVTGAEIPIGTTITGVTANVSFTMSAATTLTAYGGASSTFDDEALVVLGEIDPALTGTGASPNPAPWAFDLRNYAPKWFLVNGAPYSSVAASITTAGGNRLLLRYLNVGIQHHSIGVLGLRQRVLADDGNELPYPRTMVAETLAPGQSADVLVAMPVSAATSTKYALYDAAMLLNNSSANGIGGMLALIDASGTPSGTDTTGPVTSNVAFDFGTGALSASVTDAATGGSGVGAAEYFIDATGPAGSGGAMAGPFPADPSAVTATIPAATLAALVSGSHTINVHGKDTVSDAANWGAFSSVTFTIDKAGPAVSGLTLAPNPSNGSVPVALAGTASDASTGNSNVVAAEYFLGTPGVSGTGLPMTLNRTAVTVSITATITSPADGDVNVHALDAAGNWGDYTTIHLTIDSTGPATSLTGAGLGAVPNPTNGRIGVNSSTQAVRVTASFSDAGLGGSAIAAGEAFIDTAGPDGTGFPFLAADGTFNLVTETGFADIPLTTIRQLPDGPHDLLVHGRDGSGNWGPTEALSLIVDKTAPVLASITATPNPTNTTTVPYTDATSFVLHANATDATTFVTGGEWWEGADPGAGAGVAFGGLDATIDFVARDWAAGNRTLNARVRDAAGTWSTVASTVVVVVLPDTVFADSFGSGDTTAWTSETDTANALSVTAGASLSGSPAYGMQTTLGGTAVRHVTDSTPRLDAAYHARFSFNPNGALLANNNAGNGTTILSGLNAANNVIFQVQARRQNAGGGTYQVRLVVARAGGTTATAYTTISNATHTIGVAWQSAGSASASLVIDGGTPSVVTVTLSGLNTSANLLDAVRLGPSANLVSGATGTLYIDAFASSRRTATENLP